MKLYELKFKVRHGEFISDFTELYEAKDDDDANRKAHVYCCGFYGGDSEKLDENSYEFDCGCVILTIDCVREVEKEAWKEEQFSKVFRVIE